MKFAFIARETTEGSSEPVRLMCRWLGHLRPREAGLSDATPRYTTPAGRDSRATVPLAPLPTPFVPSAADQVPAHPSTMNLHWTIARYG